MPGAIQSIERAAAVLELIAAGPRPLRLAELSAALELPKGTVHGILRTLAEIGFVTQDRATGRYQLGSGLLTLGSGVIDANEMRARSMNWADPLAARTGEAVRLGMLAMTEVLVVHYVFRPDNSAQLADVGARLPAHVTALGKVLLAFNPGALARFAGPLTAHTPRSIVDPAALGEELDRIRRQRFAVDFREHLIDQASIAAPVYGYGGLVVAAVAIHGDTDRICDSLGTPHPRLVNQVIDCAHAISRELESSRRAG